MLTVTQDELKTLVDKIFAFAEEKAGAAPAGWAIVLGLKEVNALVDQAGIPALFDYLKQHGLVA